MNWTQELWEEWFRAFIRTADEKGWNTVSLSRANMDSAYGDFQQIPAQFASSLGWRMVDRNINGLIDFERIA